MNRLVSAVFTLPIVKIVGRVRPLRADVATASTL